MAAALHEGFLSFTQARFSAGACEIVRAIEGHVDVGEQRSQPVRSILFCSGTIFTSGFMRKARTQRCTSVCRPNRCDENLPLQVVRSTLSGSARGACRCRGGKVERGGASHAAGADDERMRRAQPLLPSIPISSSRCGGCSGGADGSFRPLGSVVVCAAWSARRGRLALERSPSGNAIDCASWKSSLEPSSIGLGGSEVAAPAR